MNPVTRNESEKQAWVDFVTTTSALLDVSFSSGCGRCSNQYHAPPSAAKKTTAIAGLRYSERIIAGSIQTYAENTISDFIQSLRARAKQSRPTKASVGLLHSVRLPPSLFELRRTGRSLSYGGQAAPCNNGKKTARFRNEQASRRAAGRLGAAEPQPVPRPLYLDAVDLFSILTTCTRRLTSASRLAGSLSLLLPYPTVTRSEPVMPYLSTRYFLIESARRSERSWL